MVEFFQTRMGRKFYEVDVPNIAKSLEKIANFLEKNAKEKDHEPEREKNSTEPS